MSVCMQDIASETGVSRMTVSRILRGLPGASQETRKRVQHAANRLGYRLDARVSHVMRSFRTSQATNWLEPVAVLQHSKNPHWSTVIQESAPTAAAFGLKLDTFFIDEFASPSQRTASILTTRGIRGVLVTPGVQALPKRFALPWDDYTCVVLGSTYTQQGLPRVRSDHFQLVYNTITNLLNYGYRNIGMAVSVDFNNRTERRLQGAFLSAPHTRSSEKTIRSLMLFDSWEPQAISQWAIEAELDALIVSSRKDYHSLRSASPELVNRIGLATFSDAEIDHDLTGMQENHQAIFQNAIRLISGMLISNETGLKDAPPIIHVPGQWRDGCSATRLKI